MSDQESTEGEVTKASGFQELGLSGLKRDGGGYVHEEFLPQLQDERGRRVWQEMSDNDPIVGAFLNTIDMLIRQVDWRTLPAGESPQEHADADFVESCRTDMSMTWQDLIGEVLSMVPYGWAYHEIVYKRRRGPQNKNPQMRSQYDDGRIGWRKLPIRSQDSLLHWDFDDNGGINGLWQMPPPTFEKRYIPIERALLFRPRVHKGNPEGRSTLRSAYRSWLFKKRVEEIEGIGIERDLAGLPIMYVDPKILQPDASDADKAFLAQLQELVMNIRRDRQEGALLPMLYDERGNQQYALTLLSTGSRRQFDTNAIINRYDQRMAMTLLSDFLMMGHNQHGSFAIASSRTNLLTLAISSWLEQISSVFNEIAIPRLFDMNGLQRDEYPKISHGDISTPDLNELGNFIVQLANAGSPLFPDDRLEEHLRQAANLPPPSIPAAERNKEAEKRGLIQDSTPTQTETPPNQVEQSNAPNPEGQSEGSGA